MSAFSCRLPDDLHRLAAQAAKAQGLSLNALVVLALRAHLATAGEEAVVSAAGDTAAPPQTDGLDQKPVDPVAFTCPARFRPLGILGADFFVEFRRAVAGIARESNRIWYRDCDRRLKEVRS